MDGVQLLDVERAIPYDSMCLKRDLSGEIRIIRYERFNKPYDVWGCDMTTKSGMPWIIQRTAQLMNMFNVKVVSFFSVIIDHHFISHFEKVWRTKSMDELRFRNTSLVDPKGDDVAKRMLNLLITAQPTTLHIDTEGLIEHFDEDFLQKYANTVTFPTLTVSGDAANHFYADESFEGTLVAFNSIEIDRILVDPDWVVSAIVKRLKRMMSRGSIRCRVTRDITLSDIQPLINGNFECSEEDGYLLIRLNCITIEYTATIKTTAASPLRLSVAFGHKYFE